VKALDRSCGRSCSALPERMLLLPKFFLYKHSTKLLMYLAMQNDGNRMGVVVYNESVSLSLFPSLSTTFPFPSHYVITFSLSYIKRHLS
jgi:hypothetical protein